MCLRGIYCKVLCMSSSSNLNKDSVSFLTFRIIHPWLTRNSTAEILVMSINCKFREND